MKTQSPQIKQVRPSDVITYKELPSHRKTLYRNRIEGVCTKMVAEVRETSILPPEMVRSIWRAKVPKKDLSLYTLTTILMFDGGTCFYIIGNN